MLLDKQYYNPDDPRPYDDIGWTLGPLYNVETVRITDTAFLKAPMALVAEPVRSPSGIANAEGARVFLIDYNADNNLTSVRFKHRNLKIDAAEQPFTRGGLQHAGELASAPALIDARLERGHVILFSFNPIWRSGTLGSYALVFNALLHHGNLGTGRNQPAKTATTTAAQ